MANDATTAVELKTADGVPIRPGMVVYVPSVSYSTGWSAGFARAIVLPDPMAPGQVISRVDVSTHWVCVLTHEPGSNPALAHWGVQHVHSSASSFMRQTLEDLDARLRANRAEIEAIVAAEEAARAAQVGV